jgi:serine/threonine-protein kinase
LLEDLRARLGATYDIERELGGGGMSRVFLAEEIALGRRVVLKVLPPELALVISAARFEREIRVAARLQHPHIVPLLAAGLAGEVLYYTMPLVEGESLRERLDRQHELPVAEAARLLRDVADALAYAHRGGVVHRDIKPDNILLSNRHAMVTDFGVARALSEAVGAATVTRTGMAVGTPAYMAPEQAAGDVEIDHRADLYALGVVAYEMLAGQPPFRGTTFQALVAAQLTASPAPLTDARPSVAAEFAAVVHRCLEKRAADRSRMRRRWSRLWTSSRRGPVTRRS